MAIDEPIDDRLSKAFSALADPTRRAILARLTTGEATVSELLAPFELSQPTISKHLKVLEDAEFIERGRDAQRRPRKLVTYGAQGCFRLGRAFSQAMGGQARQPGPPPGENEQAGEVA